MNNLAPFAAVVDRKEFAAALRLAGKIVEKRNTIPILCCVLLQPLPGGGMRMLATDLDILATLDVAAYCEGGAPVAVEFAALKAAMGKAKGDSIHLADVGGAVTFRDGDNGATLRFPSRKAADFPATLPMGTMGAEFSIPAPQLASDLERARVAVSTEETRYYLNGIFMHRTGDGFGNEVFCMAATDGHRMTRITRPVPDGMPADFRDAIVPRKTCDVLAMVLAKRADDVRLAFSAKSARFRLGRMVIDTKLVDGTFPDYARVIPSLPDRSLAIAAGALSDAVRGVTAHGSGKDRAAMLSWHADAGWLTAFYRCADNGPAGMVVQGGDVTDSSGDPFAIYFNARYLAELLAQWPGAVTLGINDANCPIRITSDDCPEYLQVLMPMRGAEPHPISPEDIARLNRTPADTFEHDAPGMIGRLAELESDEELSPSARRAELKHVRRALAKIVQDAIGYLAASAAPAPVAMGRFAEMHLGGKMAPAPLGSARRRGARLAVLLKLAEMRGDDGEAARLRAIIAHGEAVNGSYAAVDQAGSSLAEEHGAIDGGDEGEAAPAESPAPSPVPQPGEAAPVEAEPVAVVALPAPGEKPLFRSLQDFKAMAGVGSRWSLRNWDSRAGTWGEERFRIIAKVKARDIGFIQGEATALEAAAIASEAAPKGLSWWGFPKSGEWESTPVGLISFYRDGSPCMMLCPAPLETDQAAPASQPDDVAALRDMVAMLTDRLDRLEKAAQERASDEAQPEGAAPESLPAPALAENSGDMADTEAYDEAAHGWKAKYEAAHGDACRYRSQWEAAEKALAAKSGRLKIAEESNDAEYRLWKEEKAALVARAEAAEAKVEQDRVLMSQELAGRDRSIQRAWRRVGRLMTVLAGRKAQLAAVGKELLFARTKAATLQRERDEADRLARTLLLKRDQAPHSVSVKPKGLTYSIGGRKAG